MTCGKCGGKGSKGCCLCPCSFGLALGITSGLFMAVCAWMAWLWGVGTGMVAEYGVVYYGVAPTLMGGVWAAIWGLIIGFIFGFILILCYNLILCCCRHKNNSPSE